MTERKIHIAPPCSATEIKEAVGVTSKDMEVVLEVLHELYPKQFASTGNRKDQNKAESGKPI